MTVCIAGINRSNPWPMIIAACDRKISFFGGWSSADGVAVKMTGINKDWTVMFSGPVSPMAAMIDAIRERTKNLKRMDFRSFARLCRQVYREERKPLIESEVLGDYDIENYAEYMSLRRAEPEFYAKLTEKIREAEQEWNLLFAGYDRKRWAHLFTISESGKITFCDKEGFAAIGSGAWRALLALSSYPFKSELPLSNAIFGIVAAKFAAEAADGVGKETILTILEAGQTSLPVFGSVSSLRKLWEDLPRFPGDSASAEIWNELTTFQQLGWLRNPKRKLDRAGQKSKSPPDIGS